MSTRQKIHSGFTLVEISIAVTLVVILALAILTTINPIAQIFKGYDTRRKADLAMLKTAFESYYADYDCYPPATILNNCGGAELQPYLSQIPCDPNDKTPYKIFTLPEGSACPQKYAIYAPILSFFDKLADSIPSCPQTFAVYSSDILNVEIAEGCSSVRTCATLYGCKSGFCTIVSQDSVSPSCHPTSCYADCGGRDCQETFPNGSYVNECVAF